MTDRAGAAEADGRPADAVSAAEPANAALAMIAADLRGNPRFAPTIKALSMKLAGLSDAMPRIGKLLGSHRRWFLVQIGYALYCRGLVDPASGGLTVARLVERVDGLGVASRNTIVSFTAEMKAYRLIRPVAASTSRRSRPLEPSEQAHAALGGWMAANLAALDALDGGDRTVRFAARPELMVAVQPAMIDALVGEEEFVRPPPGLANFLGREAGGLVLDGLIASIATVPERPDPAGSTEMLALGRLNFSALARRFQLSRVNLDRMIRDAEAMGLFRRREDGSHAMSMALFAAHLDFQARKLAAIACAFEQAGKTPGEPPVPR